MFPANQTHNASPTPNLAQQKIFLFKVPKRGTHKPTLGEYAKALLVPMVFSKKTGNA